MKSLYSISSVMLSFMLFISCGGKNNNPPEEIPVEDRFIYNLGDTLIYKCSDGSADTVNVKDYRLWTTTGSTTDMYGNEHIFERQLQRIIIESSSDNWNRILRIVLSGDDFIYHCYIIETIETVYDTDGNPFCWIINGCNYGGGLPIFAESNVKYPEISFNNNSYKKVYFDSRNLENNSYKIYWNLKYGIIRFESFTDGTLVTWDLVNHNK
jgi:hypothetical protein